MDIDRSRSHRRKAMSTFFKRIDEHCKRSLRATCVLILGWYAGGAFADTSLDAAVAEVGRQLRAMPEAQAAGETATHRYHAALTSAALSVYEQSRHLDLPYFAASDGIDGRVGLVNPDNLYTSALLADTGRYRIHGKRGTHALLSLQLLDAYPIVGLGRNLAVIDLDALHVRPGQNFELFLGGERRSGLWAALPRGTKAVLSRQTFVNWTKESPSRLSIERLDEPAEAVAPDEASATAGDYLLAAARTWNLAYLPALAKLPINQLLPPRPSDSQAGGLAGQQSVMARFRLKPDQALLITARKTPARYQALQIGDPWFVTPHFIRHQVSLNQSQATTDPDGFIRYIVSASDPGLHNWVDTAGNSEGYIFMRWQGLGRELKQDEWPKAELVEIADLKSHLPPTTLQASREDRSTQRRARLVSPLRQR